MYMLQCQNVQSQSKNLKIVGLREKLKNIISLEIFSIKLYLFSL